MSAVTVNGKVFNIRPLTPEENVTADAYISLMWTSPTTVQVTKFLLANCAFLPCATIRSIEELIELQPGCVVHDQRIIIIARTIYQFFILAKKAA